LGYSDTILVDAVRLLSHRAEHTTIGKICLHPEADLYGVTRQGFQVAWLVENCPPEDSPVEPKWTIGELSQILEIVEETDS